MNYSPKQELKKTYFLSLCFMIPGAVIFSMASTAPFTVIMQAAGLTLCSLGIFVMYRYALTSFHFKVEDGELTVHKISGKRINAVARVALSECESLVKMEGDTLKGKKYPGGKYKYTVNYAPESEYLLTFRDGENTVALILECEQSVVAALSSLMPENSEIKL
ncbi:MAG: hypothetical protein IJ519_01040 [Clostridia bacterium]|nr:hypothetical protein [Clostridia bacterium]